MWNWNLKLKRTVCDLSKLRRKSKKSQWCISKHKTADWIQGRTWTEDKSANPRNGVTRPWNERRWLCPFARVFFFIFGWVLREISIVENTKELVAKAGRCGADVVGRSSLTCRSNDDGVAFRRLQTTQRASTVGPDHLHCPLYHYEPKENVIAQKNDPQGMELENGSDLTIAFSSNYGSLRVFSWLECDIHRINHECGLPMKYATEWSTPLGTSSTENPVQPCCVFVEYWGSVEVDFVRTVTCRRPRWPMWLFAFFFNRKRRITSSWWWSTATVVTWPTTCQVSRRRETSKGNQSYFNCFADLNRTKP